MNYKKPIQCMQDVSDLLTVYLKFTQDELDAILKNCVSSLIQPTNVAGMNFPGMSESDAVKFVESDEDIQLQLEILKGRLKEINLAIEDVSKHHPGELVRDNIVTLRIKYMIEKGQHISNTDC